MTYRVVRYSREHIHTVELIGRGPDDVRERCYLSRNWNRCTAFPLSRAGYAELTSTDRRYYDGNDWTRAPRPCEAPDLGMGG